MVTELILLAVVAFVVGIAIDTVWDYFEYKNGRLGWNLLPRTAKYVWRRRHPNEVRNDEPRG